MLRYYFDLHNNLDVYRDEDGLEFESDEAARIGAIRRLSGLLSNLAEVGSDTKLIILAVRQAGERDPFAAISMRFTSFE